jgi:hypothetical protein
MREDFESFIQKDCIEFSVFLFFDLECVESE